MTSFRLKTLSKFRDEFSKGMRINGSYKKKGALLKIQRLDTLNYSLFHRLVGLTNFLIRDWLLHAEEIL